MKKLPKRPQTFNIPPKRPPFSQMEPTNENRKVDVIPPPERRIWHELVFVESISLSRFSKEQLLWETGGLQVKHCKENIGAGIQTLFSPQIVLEVGSRTKCPRSFGK